ncbi:MAG TPA: alpha/beta hydrolase [Azospirillaceae bacterium]|nr:alpha/beta hydrolase [Azospirillaceae bacterium]
MPEITTSDGVRLSYEEAGQGRALLLVHGWSAHAGFFAPQIDELSKSFRVIAPDLRGHRHSPAPPLEATVERLALDIADLLAALDLRDVVAVGWSLGAMVLWRALLDGAAERIAGMVVVDMTPRVPGAEDWQLGMLGGYEAEETPALTLSMRQDWPAYTRRIVRRLFAADRPPDTGLADWAEAEIARNDPAWMAGLWQSLAGQDFRAALSGIPTPTLVVHGGRSQLYGAGTAAYLETTLPDARRVAFDRSGHTPHLEEPELFNRIIEEFAAGLPTGPTNGIAHRTGLTGAPNRRETRP